MLECHTNTMDQASSAGRRVVETGFQKKLIEKNKALMDFHLFQKIFFINTKRKQVGKCSC